MGVTSRSTSHESATALLAALLGGGQRATRHAPMQPRGSTAKYRTRHRAPTDAELTAHLAGAITLAGVLIGRDGLAGAGLIELDILAEQGSCRALTELAVRGVVAFAIATPGAGEHDGSHVWALYQERADPRAIAHQLTAAARAAGLPTDEIYPSGKAIRLPFGLHRWTGRRGVLLLQDGRRFDLDTPEQFAAGLAAVLALPRNPVPPQPASKPVPTIAPVPALTARQERPTSSHTGRTDAREVIARFNAEHPIESLLIQYGATRTRDGWACNCGVAHEHETQLIVTDQGRIVFLSARCRLAPGRTDRNGRPIADAFDLYTKVEHGGNKKAATAALRPAQARQPAANYPEADSAAYRAQEAARKRESRRTEALTTLQAVRDRAAEDAMLARRPAERAVLQALLDVAGERAWCRPSKTRLAELSGVSLGAVKRALGELEARGYFASNGDGGGPNDTAVRTFLRGSAPAEAPDTPTWIRVIHESIEESVLGIESLIAGEGGAGGQGEPDSLDTWEWSLDCHHGADELITLEAGSIAPPLTRSGPALQYTQTYADGANLDEDAAVDADMARVLAYRAAKREQQAPQIRAISYVGGARFDPEVIGLVSAPRLPQSETAIRALNELWYAETGQGAPLPGPAAVQPAQSVLLGEMLGTTVAAPDRQALEAPREAQAPIPDPEKQGPGLHGTCENQNTQARALRLWPPARYSRAGLVTRQHAHRQRGGPATTPRARSPNSRTSTAPRQQSAGRTGGEEQYGSKHF